MLAVTDQAARKIRSILKEQQAESAALRVMVVSGGCSGFQYMMALETDQQPGDTVVQADGIRLLVDADSASLLEGAEIDYAEEIMRSGFVINNPNAVRNCACGQSFRTADNRGEPRPCQHS